MLDYFDVGPGFGLVKIRAPEAWVGRALREVDPTGLGLTPIALRRGERVVVNPSRDTMVEVGDELTLIGPDDRLASIPR